MNYPDNANMDLVLDLPDLEFSHYEISYDGDKVKDEEFTILKDAVEAAKTFTKQMALDTGCNFEKVTIEIAYEGEFENDSLKSVEYDAECGEWEVV